VRVKLVGEDQAKASSAYGILPQSWNGLVLTVGFGLCIVEVSSCVICANNPNRMGSTFCVDTVYKQPKYAYTMGTLLPSYDGFCR